MTIECLHVDLADCFAIGQAYVACSRGKCLNSMTVKNFKQTEIKTSEKVKAFYAAVKNKKSYGGTWSDTIEEFDENTRRENDKKREMKQHYNNVTRCSKCGVKCVVNQIKTNKNGNQGKYFISCPDSNGERGHSWELVSSEPQKK